MKASTTSRRHVLAFLDGTSSEGRRLADQYREQNGLKTKDRCVYCDTKGHYYTCPTCDRGGYSCSNYNNKDEQKRKREESKRLAETGYRW